VTKRETETKRVTNRETERETETKRVIKRETERERETAEGTQPHFSKRPNFFSLAT